MQVVIISNSLAQTHEVGEKIGAGLESGNVVCLIGDLGSGKTSIAQGIAKGLDVSPAYYITSPTFTLINRYPGRHTFYHVDLYRLEDDIDFEDIGLLDILFNDGVVVIEWAEKLPEELKSSMTIRLSILDEHSRKIHLVSSEPKLIDLLKELENRVKFH